MIAYGKMEIRFFFLKKFFGTTKELIVERKEKNCLHNNNSYLSQHILTARMYIK
jgi:hypothetical protein